MTNFRIRLFSETVATAQMYWDGTNKLRLQLKMTRPTAIKVAYTTQDQQTTTERPLTPVRTLPPPRAAVLASVANRLSAFMPLPTVLLSSQFWPMPSMSRGVINCAKLFLSHPLSRIKWFDQWAVDQDPVLTLTISAKIGKTAVTSKKTRWSIRPTPSRTRKTPRPGARLGVARWNTKAYGDKIVAPCLMALRDRRHAWPVHACDAELPPCT